MSTATEEQKPANPAASVSNWMSTVGQLTQSEPAEPLEPANAQPTEPKAQPKAEPAATEPKADAKIEVKSEVKVEGDEEKWPRSSKDWSEFKAARKAKEDALVKERDGVKTELETVRKEVETLKKSGPSPELDGLKKERDELSEKLRLVAVEKHPKFQTYFDNKVNAQLDLAKRIVGEDKADRVVQALKLPEGAYKEAQLEELMGELGTMSQTRIGGVINSLAQITQERETEIANAKTSYEKITAEQAAKAEQTTKAQREQAEKMFSDAVTSAQDPKNGLAIFQKKDGDEKWNAEVQQRVDLAKNLLFGNFKPDQVAKASLYAAGFPSVLKWANEMGEENKKLQAQVKELSSASPRVSGGEAKPIEGDGAPIQHKAGIRPSEASANWTKGLMAAWQ